MKDVGLWSHLAATVLVALGFLSQCDMSTFEGSLSSAVVAAVSLVSNALVAWKHIHAKHNAS